MNQLESAARYCAELVGWKPGIDAGWVSPVGTWEISYRPYATSLDAQVRDLVPLLRARRISMRIAIDVTTFTAWADFPTQTASPLRSGDDMAQTTLLVIARALGWEGTEL